MRYMDSKLGLNTRLTIFLCPNASKECLASTFAYRTCLVGRHGPDRSPIAGHRMHSDLFEA